MATGTSEIILLITAILVTITISSVLATQVLSIQGETGSVATGVSEKIRNNIDIINDNENIPYTDTDEDGTNETLKIYIKNIGSSSLPTDKNLYNIYIDGVLAEINSTEIIKGSGEQLNRGEVLLIKAKEEALKGPYQLEVTINGATDTKNIILP